MAKDLVVMNLALLVIARPKLAKVTLAVHLIKSSRFNGSGSGFRVTWQSSRGRWVPGKVLSRTPNDIRMMARKMEDLETIKKDAFAVDYGNMVSAMAFSSACHEVARFLPIKVVQEEDCQLFIETDELAAELARQITFWQNQLLRYWQKSGTEVAASSVSVEGEMKTSMKKADFSCQTEQDDSSKQDVGSQAKVVLADSSTSMASIVVVADTGCGPTKCWQASTEQASLVNIIECEVADIDGTNMTAVLENSENGIQVHPSSSKSASSKDANIARRAKYNGPITFRRQKMKSSALAEKYDFYNWFVGLESNRSWPEVCQLCDCSMSDYFSMKKHFARKHAAILKDFHDEGLIKLSKTWVEMMNNKIAVE